MQIIPKEMQTKFQKAEQNYIVNTINKGLEENNSKPFWRYIKSKKQDNIGVSPSRKMQDYIMRAPPRLKSS